MCPFRGSPAVPPSLAASSLPTSAHGGKHLNRRLRVDRYSFPFPRNTRSLRAPIPANGYTRGFRQLGEGGVRSSTTGATRNWCGEARPFLDRIACRGGCGGHPEGVDKPLSESKCATAVVACAPSSHSRASSTVFKERNAWSTVSEMNLRMAESPMPMALGALPLVSPSVAPMPPQSREALLPNRLPGVPHAPGGASKLRPRLGGALSRLSPRYRSLAVRLAGLTMTLWPPLKRRTLVPLRRALAWPSGRPNRRALR